MLFVLIFWIGIIYTLSSGNQEITVIIMLIDLSFSIFIDQVRGQNDTEESCDRQLPVPTADYFGRSIISQSLQIRSNKQWPVPRNSISLLSTSPFEENSMNFITSVPH